MAKKNEKKQAPKAGPGEPKKAPEQMDLRVQAAIKVSESVFGLDAAGLGKLVQRCMVASVASAQQQAYKIEKVPGLEQFEFVVAVSAAITEAPKKPEEKK